MADDKNLNASRNRKQSQLEQIIDEMFQNESDRIIDDEEEDVGYGKVIITMIAIMMSAVIILSFLYKFL